MNRRLATLCLACIAVAALAACSVYMGNIRPIASFIATPTGGTWTSPVDVNFDASASHDPDGTVDAYFWDFGDGQTRSAVVATTYQYIVQTNPETFTVALTVTDNLGATDTAVRNITVDP